MEKFIELNENQPKQFTHGRNELNCKMTINQCGIAYQTKCVYIFQKRYKMF